MIKNRLYHLSDFLLTFIDDIICCDLHTAHIAGQFRDTKTHDIKLEDALDAAQNLAAHTTALIHIYEANVVTSGEVIVEVTNNQVGMGNLHSTLPVCGAVISAVLACVEENGGEIYSCV